MRYVGQVNALYDYCDWTDQFTQEMSGIQPQVIMVLYGTWDVVDRQLAG